MQAQLLVKMEVSAVHPELVFVFAADPAVEGFVELAAASLAVNLLANEDQPHGSPRISS